MAIKAAKRQYKEAIQLDYRPKNIAKEELVSENKYKPGEDIGARGDSDDDISIFG